jgi:hypothetical protein
LQNHGIVNDATRIFHENFREFFLLVMKTVCYLQFCL